ncbi:MAG: NarK/NasA family nitrate transporter, partial [Chloroflexi bacterium]|nr:NarK/NasA family nitrate transporter [Chloroflexota bacterium]
MKPVSESKQAASALIMSTFAFTVCFASWVINAVMVTFLISNGIYEFNGSELGWLLAAPILTGAVTRVPLGIMTDKYGGRMIFVILLLTTAIPMFLVSFADSYWQFLLASLGYGLAGGSFAVGIGYISVWFKKARQGTALGIFGMGNAGAAVTTLLSPQLLNWYTDMGDNLEGWRNLPRSYAALLILTAFFFYFMTKNRKLEQEREVTLLERLAPLKNIVVWRFGLYYFLVFGAFVTIAQWLIPYSVNVYQISVVQAGVLAAAFSLPSGLIRALGGWLSDKFGAHSVMHWVFLGCAIACFVLAVPRMDINSPGPGIIAKGSGEVNLVSD